MERARLAMENVKLGSSGGSFDLVSYETAPSPSVARLIGDTRARMRSAGVEAVNGATRILHWIWHRVGYTTFRILSTLNLLFAVVAGVALQILAYYYRGALNAEPAICAFFYAPALGGMAVLREALQANGSSASGVSPAHSRAVLSAYGAMLLSAVLAFAQPVVVRWMNGISSTSMWISISGSLSFFYALLISEVLFAAAVNLKQARYRNDEEDQVGEDVPDYGTMGV